MPVHITADGSPGNLRLDGLDLTEGAQRQPIDPSDVSLMGDVTSRFTPRQMAF